MDRRIDDVRPAQGLEWEGAGGLTLERSVTEPCQRCNGTGKWTYTEDAGDVGSEYKCQDCEPAQVQPVAAALPASDEPTLYSRLMEISDIVRAGSRWDGNEYVFVEKGESDVAMIDDLLGDALRLARSNAPALPVEQPSQPGDSDSKRAQR